MIQLQEYLKFRSRKMATKTSFKKLALAFPALVAIAFTSTALVSCGSSDVNQTTDNQQPTEAVSPTTTSQSKLVVYVTNYPLKYFAERIGGDAITVKFPIPSDIDPAFWAPEASDIAQLQEADLIFLNGASYEKWLQTVSLSSSKLVDTSSAFSDRYLTIEDTITHNHGPSGEHSHKGTAFTTWINFQLAIEQATAIRDALSDRLPEQQEIFDANLTALEEQLIALDRQIEATVANSQDKNQPLLASHPVYDYFSNRYGLNLKSVLWEPETVPDQQQWDELKKILAAHPAKWMIWEGEPNQESVNRLKELRIESIVFAPAGNTPESDNFVEVMQANADNLKLVFTE